MAANNYFGRERLSTVNEKELRKELKDLKKEIKKKKNPWAVVAAYFLAFKLANEKELKEVDKEASRVLGAESIKEAILSFVQEANLEKLLQLEGDIGRFFRRLKEKEVDEEFKALFKQMPSLLFKAFLVRDFVRQLLDTGHIDEAFFFLNQVEKVKWPEISYLLGWAYDAKGIVNLAKDHLEKAAKAGLKEAKQKLAMLYVKQGEFGKAAKICEELGDLKAALESYLESGDLKKCRELVSKVDISELKIKLAVALVDRDRKREALEVVEQLDSPEAKIIKAKIIKYKDLEGAYELVKEVFPEVRGRFKEWALEIIADYYTHSGMWKELTTILSPLETPYVVIKVKAQTC